MSKSKPIPVPRQAHQKVRFLVIILLIVTGVSFAETQVTVLSAGSCVLGQIISDNQSEQFLLNGETGKIWQLLYDSKHMVYLIEVPILTKEEVKNRSDIKTRYQE